MHLYLSNNIHVRLDLNVCTTAVPISYTPHDDRLNWSESSLTP